jgi:DNA-binding transcriptional LysR family regulator
MEMRHLRYFVAAAHLEHFGKAAARLSIVQPALSRQIGELEAELGVILFERLPRGVRLTAAGRVFLSEAESLLAHAGHATQRARDTASGRSGRLRIGFVDTAVYAPTLPRLFHAFRRRHPAVRLALASHPSLRQGELLREGALDLALVYHEPVAVRSLATRRLATEKIVLAIPATNPLARRRRVSLAEIAGKDLVWIPRTLSPIYYDRIFTACREKGFEPRIVQEASTDQAILSLVALGVGLSFCVASAAHHRPAGVVLRPIADLDFAVHLTAAWRTINSNPSLELFLSLLPQARESL